MKDLSSICYLSVSLNEDGRLSFGEGITEVTPAIRTLDDSRIVLEDREADGPGELYYMYREMCREADREGIRSRGLRYDITVIRPGKVGREYVKTVGHYHPAKPGTDYTFPEVYEVINGKAHYLFQRPGEEAGAEEVIMIEALPGDKVLIPPNYGHITINPGDDFLVMSNWVASDFSSVYEPLEKLGGGAYFEVEVDGRAQFEANPKYSNLPPLRKVPVVELRRFDLVKEVPMYQIFLRDPDKLDFLINPEKYSELVHIYS